MSLAAESELTLGNVQVYTSQEGGASPEELTERALNKIIYVGNNSHPLVAEQAQEFKDSIRGVILFYIKEAGRAERVNLVSKFTKAGHPELIKLLDT